MLNYGTGPFPHVIRLENARQTLNTELHELPYLPACLRQYQGPVPPSQPQAQALLPNTSEASSRGLFTTNHIFFTSVLPQSSGRCKLNSTKKTDASLRDKSSCFGCSDSVMVIWGKRKKAAVLNLAPSVET